MCAAIIYTMQAKRSHSFQCENIIYTALLVTSLTTGCSFQDEWDEYFEVHPFRQKLIKATINYLINCISFYPYPFTGISITGHPTHLSLILPYVGYTRTQVAKKLSYAVRVHGN